MKSVLISIQPYYVFLIIARLMGWNIPQEKTVEVRKDFPKDPTWNKRVLIYCSKNKRSFKRIPAEYQPLMSKFLGKVIGEFACDKIIEYEACVDYGVTEDKRIFYCGTLAECTGLTRIECFKYGCRKYKLQNLYGWHISDLKIYDTLKELSEFRKPCKWEGKGEEPECFICSKSGYTPDMQIDCFNTVERPPQSWGYVEEL